MAESTPLSPRERAKLYRRYADEASRAAESAKRAQLREAYALLAAGWIEMAEELEGGLRKV